MAREPEKERPPVAFDHDPGASASPTVPSDRDAPVGEEVELEGVPDEEDVDAGDVGERLDEGSVEQENRRDVPPTPENTIEARTRDDADAEEITRP